jgi:PmbA protein
MGREELEALVRSALEEATQRGADQAEVAASSDTGLSATARLGDVENLEYTNDRGLWVTVYKNKCKGSASTTDIRPESIREAVNKACTFASCTAQDEHSGLADADLMCADIRDLDLNHPWSIEASDAIDLAIACEDAGLTFDPRINNSEGATVSTNRGTRAYGNTHGFVGSFSKSSHSISCVVLAGENDEMQRDYYYSAARDAADLEDVAYIGETAGKRAVSRLGAKKIKTTKAPVLYIPELARGFIGHSIGAIGRSTARRRFCWMLRASRYSPSSCRYSNGHICQRPWRALRTTLMAWQPTTGTLSPMACCRGMS